jgi:cytochrome c553
MNMAVAFSSDKDIEDIAAYYQSLGKPAVTSPYWSIKGEEVANAK